MSGAVLALLPFAASTFAAPRPGASTSASGADWIAYAQYLGATVEEARTDSELVGAASELQQALEARFPSEFAGLWVDRNPSFTVVAALTADRRAEVRGLAPAALLPYLETRVHDRSLRELQGLVATLRVPQIPHAVSIDVRTNQIEIQVLRGKADMVSQSLAGRTPAGLARVVETTGLPTPVAIYGGLNHHTTCGGLEGTVGFSVKKNGVATTGIVTAGHLANCGTVNGWNLTFKAESNGGNADAEWFTSATNEPAKIKWNFAGNERVITARKAYGAIVIGEFTCKYGRTTGYECGEVHSKTVDPDGIFGPFAGVWVEIQDCGQSDLAEPGDSGGPVFLNNTAIGILTHQGGDIFCGGKGYYNSLTHFEAVLGITVLTS